MDQRYETVSLLTDYGLDDEFVGVVKSVVRSLAPHTHVIDITHGIAPHDVRAGGLALARSVQYLCSGVVVAVVDPGVGTDRRAIAVEVGEGEAVLVGPDNGLLAPAVAMVGGADRVVSLTNDAFHLPAPGPTFDGRDLFAPVAAHLANGVPFEDLGELIDPNSVMPGVLPIAETGEHGLEAEVLWIDRFGNIQLNVDPDDLPDGPVQLVVGGQKRTAQRVRAFADIPTGSLGVLVDSYGLLAIAEARGSAALVLGVRSGDQISVLPLDEDDTVVSSPVELGRKADR